MPSWPGSSKRRAGELIEGHSAIDQRIVLPHGWLRSPAGVWQLRKQLQDLAFDTAIDAQGLTKSAAVAWLSGAKRRIGMGGRWGREFSRWLNNELVDTDGLHAIERALKLLEPLGIRSPAVRFEPPVATADQNVAAEIIASLGLDGGFVLIASGAGWPSKLWPVDRYAAVAAWLGRRWNLPSLLIWGNDAERAGRSRSSPPRRAMPACARRSRCGSWPQQPAGHVLQSAPTLGRCTWPRPPARPASASTGPGRPTNTVPTALSTSTCKKCACPAPRTSGGMRRRVIWRRLTWSWFARRASG